MLKQKFDNDFLMREFPLTQRDFDRIKDLAYKITGIKLSDHKKNMIYGRLARRVRALSLENFAQYCDLLEQAGSEELSQFVNAITTNLTSFFREKHHFDYLQTVFIPELLARGNGERRIRIWSAGCSTGEEAYSIAMVCHSVPALKSWDLKILATDLDSNVVERGRSATYDKDRLERVPREYEHCLQRNELAGQVRIRPEVAKLVTFKQLNLLLGWPMKGPFDLIFCRNVVIYFDAPTQARLFQRFAQILKPDGYLFIGHSENLHAKSNEFHSLGKTMYRRKL